MGIPVEDFIADQSDPPPPRTRTLCTATDCPCLDCPRRRAQLFSHPQHSRSVRPTPPPFREALVMMDAAIEARRRTTLRNNLAEIAVAATANLQHHPQPPSSSSDSNNDNSRRLDTPHASAITSSSMTTAPGSTSSSRSSSSTQAGSSAAQQQTDSDTESPPSMFRHALHSLPPPTAPQPQRSPSYPSRTLEATSSSVSVLSSASAPTSVSSSSTPSVAVSPTSTPIPTTLQSSQSSSSGSDGGLYRNILWNRRNSTGSNLNSSGGTGDVDDHVVRSGHYSSTLEEAEETLPRLTPRPLSTAPASLTGSATSSLPSPTESVAMDSGLNITAHHNATGQQVNNNVEHAIEGADSNSTSAVQEWAVRMELEGTDYYHDSDDDSAHGHHHARLQRIEQEVQRQRQQQPQQQQ